MSITRAEVEAVLDGVAMPGGQSLGASGLVRALVVEGGAVRFVIEVDPAEAKTMKPVRALAEARLRALPGVQSVQVAMTAHSAPKAPPSLKVGGHPTPQAGPLAVPGVARIIAVASGKGGVGKSTVAANLAVALAREGRRTGLLDADIYGPSQPRMMGVTGRLASPDGKTILPLQGHGVTMMSIGLMMREGEAVVWRGPMLMGALQQMLFQVKWGDLDVLVVDLPPGTGDVQLTLCQKTPLAGAVVVCTPQDVALLDARKGIDMFRKLGTPIFGLVENMSTHVCSNCGHEEHIFGHGGVRREAEALNVPLLAEIPLHINIRLSGDAGVPVVVSDPEGAQARAFRELARRLMAAGAV
ncbi:MAG: Mrp/NBP35 family ATP-binding protein [Alphaproteobacteria bacterium]|nr:Mrp/NBP35 family ATP-binding protein [Alphaproteobacteria bacterium]